MINESLNYIDFNSEMGEKIDKDKMARIKEEAAKLGTSYYKFV